MMGEMLSAFKEFTKLFPDSRYVACKNKIRLNKATYTSQEIAEMDVEIGWVIPNGYTVLDFDEELEAVEKYLRENGLWKGTTIFRTPSGGLHLIYKDEVERTQRIKTHLACGLKADLRISGKGYIITPFNDDAREVVTLRPPTNIPIELMPLEIKATAEQFLTFPLKEGSRNDTLFRQASRLRTENFEEDSIVHILKSINRAFLSPALTDKEIETIANSVCKYEKGKSEIEFAIVNEKGGVVAVDVQALVDWLINTNSMYAVNGELYVYKDGVFSENGVYIRDLIKKAIPPKYVSFGKVMEIYKLLCDDIRIQVDYDFLNRNKDVVNMKNGVFDLATGTLKSHAPDYISTVQINAEWVDTTNLKLKDTLFGEFLMDVCAIDGDDVKMLLEFMTYTMTLYNNKKCMLFLVGPSNTGKSVLIKVMEAIIGYHNISNVGLHELNQRFYPASLKDKLLNSNADNSSIPLSGIENIKKITGQDAIMHEKKGANPFFFFPFAKLMFSFNQLPLQLEEKSDAFYKRLRVLHMPKKIVLDQAYVDKLCSQDEVNKVASMLLRAYGKRMYETNVIYNSKHSQDLVAQLRAGSDTVEAFLHDGCVNGLYVEKKELYDAYVSYCLQTDRKHAGVHSFYKTMIDKGFEEERMRLGKKTLIVYRGIEVKR